MTKRPALWGAAHGERTGTFTSRRLSHNGKGAADSRKVQSAGSRRLNVRSTGRGRYV